MKVIITENQYKKLSFIRRIKDIMYEAEYMIDDVGFFEGVDFCTHYPTLKRFLQGIVHEIGQQYEHPNYHIYDTIDFIHDDIGYGKFINMLMDEHGEKIRNFYKERTKNC